MILQLLLLSFHWAVAATGPVAPDSVATRVSYDADGGTITADGLYTAGPVPGTFRVVARAGRLADTAVVTLTRPVLPAALDGSSFKDHAGVFSLGHAAFNADDIIGRIAVARSQGKHLFLAMTGGKHSNYMTAGVFDMAKWRAKMDTYNTAAIRSAIAAGVADGTIVGNSVMDEPNNVSPTNNWGPAGTVTKAMVDEMCGYVKRMFPTLPVGVVHDYDELQPELDYARCDFVLAQYSESKGPVTRFRDRGLAFARRSGIAMAFSLNLLDGGTRIRGCPVPATGGRGTLRHACRMRADQVREYGMVLGPAGCALTLWRYDRQFMADPENQRAFEELARQFATLPSRPCIRS